MTCDGPGCAKKPCFECICGRCEREHEEEKFFSCQDHVNDVAAKHIRIRGRDPRWASFI